MLRNAIVVLAIVLAVGTSGLSTSAFARNGHYDSQFGGGRDGTPGEAYAGYDNRASSLHPGFRGDGGRDVWGHWGAYYGPMVPTH
jgi:hypothetical protein